MPRSNLVPIIREPETPGAIKWILGKYETQRFRSGKEARLRVGRLLDINPDTYLKKKNHPERFTYPELLKLIEFFGFTDTEVLEVMGRRSG